jgi:hypothetical protein
MQRQIPEHAHSIFGGRLRGKGNCFSSAINADSSVSPTRMRKRNLKGERDGAKRDGRGQKQSHVARWCGTGNTSGATEAVGNGDPAFEWALKG